MRTNTAAARWAILSVFGGTLVGLTTTSYAQTAPLTLEYKVTRVDIRDEAARYDQYAAVERAVKHELQQGTRTKEDAERLLSQIAILKDPKQAESFTLQLSTNGKSLMYQRIQEGKLHTVLYDGKHTYIVSPHKEELHHMRVVDGFDFASMKDFPLLGIDLPYIKFSSSVKGDQEMILIPNAMVNGEAGPGYVQARVERDSKGKVLRIEYGEASHPGTLVSDISHVEDSGLFASFRVKEVGMSRMGGPAHDLAKLDYKLISYANKAIESKSFKPETYLVNGSSVEFHDADGVTVFGFVSGGGSIQQQANRSKQNDKQLLAEREAGTHVRSFAVLTVLLLSLGTVWRSEPDFE